jgi:hypothetical protein
VGAPGGKGEALTPRECSPSMPLKKLQKTIEINETI